MNRRYPYDYDKVLGELPELNRELYESFSFRYIDEHFTKCDMLYILDVFYNIQVNSPSHFRKRDIFYMFRSEFLYYVYITLEKARR